MATDTKQERLALLRFASGAQAKVLFEPDGSVDQDDKWMMLGRYAFDGIIDPTPELPADALHGASLTSALTSHGASLISQMSTHGASVTSGMT